MTKFHWKLDFLPLQNVHEPKSEELLYFSYFTLLLKENGLRSTTSTSAWNPQNDEVIRCKTKILIDYSFLQMLPDPKLITGPAAILVLKISV